MNTLTRHPRFSALLGAASAAAVVATSSALPVAAASITASAAPDLVVSDGSDSGLISVINIPASSQPIADVNLTINLVAEPGGAWNGDLYIYVAHGNHLSVLANRPGVSASNPFGYGDNGLAQVTFDDDAALGDFHVYQLALNTGDTSLPVTGTFQPDARTSDPSSVLIDDPRLAFLSGFQGQNPSGEWRLFVADLSPGGEVRLAGWELNITTQDTTQIPDAGPGLGLISLTMLLVGLFPRFLRRSPA